MLKFVLPVLDPHASVQDALEAMVDLRCTGVMVGGSPSSEGRVVHLEDIIKAVKPSSHARGPELQHAIEHFSLGSVPAGERAEFFRPPDAASLDPSMAFRRANLLFATHQKLHKFATVWSSSETIGGRYLSNPYVGKCDNVAEPHFYPPHTRDRSQPGKCFCGSAIR